MATHSSILAWEMPRTEEPDGPHSMGPIKVGLNPATTNRSISKDHTQVCVCVCVCVCVSVSPSRRLGVCLGSFMDFCLCLSRQPSAGPLVWPRPLPGAMALAEELAQASCLPWRGCVRVCVSVCVPACGSSALSGRSGAWRAAWGQGGRLGRAKGRG